MFSEKIVHTHSQGLCFFVFHFILFYFYLILHAFVKVLYVHIDTHKSLGI